MNSNLIHIEVLKYMGKNIKFKYYEKEYEGFVTSINIDYKNKYTLFIKDSLIPFEEDGLYEISIIEENIL